jgi:hypothetical protein
VVGFEIWDADAALLLLLKLEHFGAAVPVTEPPPAGWEPVMPVPDGPYSSVADPPAKAVGQAEPHTIRPIVQIQVAVPYHEALKLGWSLAEAASAALHPPEDSKPKQ